MPSASEWNAAILRISLSLSSFSATDREVDKGKYATSDVFVHYEAFADPRKVLLVSDQRILYCMKQEMLGAWAVSVHDTAGG